MGDNLNVMTQKLAEEQRAAVNIKRYFFDKLQFESNSDDPVMKDINWNAKVSSDFAQNAYPEDADLLKAVVNLAALAKIRQVKTVVALYGVDPSYVMKDLTGAFGYTPIVHKIMFAINHLEDDNIPKDEPKNYINLAEKAKIVNDYALKNRSHSMRDEIERGEVGPGVMAHVVSAVSAMNKDLFSENPKKIRAAIRELESPAVEYTRGGEKPFISEIKLWKAIAGDYGLPEDKKNFDVMIVSNVARAKEKLSLLEKGKGFGDIGTK